MSEATSGRLLVTRAGGEERSDDEIEPHLLVRPCVPLFFLRGRGVTHLVQLSHECTLPVLLERAVVGALDGTPETRPLTEHLVKGNGRC